MPLFRIYIRTHFGPLLFLLLAIAHLTSAAAASTADQVLPEGPTNQRSSVASVHLRLEVPAQGVRGAATAAETAVLVAFERANPNVQIDPYVRLRMQGPESEATLYMSMAGQTAPDALYVNGRSMQKYIDQGFLYPLDSYLTDEIKRDPEYQKLLPAMSRGGHVYGVPARVAVHALLYRKDLFSKAGLDPDKPPATWDELLADARKLTNPFTGSYGIELPGGVNAGWRFADFVWQAGGELVRRRPDGGWKLTLDEPAAVAALQFYKEMRWGKWTAADGTQQQGCMRIDATDQSALDMQEGRAAMTIVSTTGDLGRFIPDPGSYGIAPLPSGPGGSATMLEGEFWGINAQRANDPARLDTAWKYIQFVTSDQAKRIQTRVYVESGQTTSVPPDWLEKFGYAAELGSLPPAWKAFSSHMLERGRIEPFAPGYDQVATDLMAKLDEVLYNENGDPATVMKGINDRGNAAFFFDTPPEVVESRRRAARVVAAFLVFIALTVTCVVAWNGAKKRRLSPMQMAHRTDGPRAADRFTLNRLGLLFLLPAVLTILIWDYYPLLRGAVLAFMDYRVMGGSAFVGLDNFIALFTQDAFWRALVQTFVYVALSLGIGFLLPIVLAVLLSEITWGKIVFRSLFYLPAVTSGVIILSIWRVILYDGSPSGVFNLALAWMSGTVVGRVITVGAFLLAWWAFATTLAGCAIDAVASNIRQTPGRARLTFHPAMASSMVMLPIGLSGFPLASGLFAAEDVRPPVAFLINGVLAAAAVIVVGSVLTWLLGSQSRDQLKRAAAIGAAVVGIALGIKLYSLLHAPTHPYPWLQDPSGYWAMLWVIVPGLWAGMGPGCIIYLAAMKSIPDELYEAADLDGAGPLQKAFHITFRSLMPLILINFIGAVIGSFHAMENVLVLTGGGPGDRTMTLGMDIFFNAFTHLRFGYATAEAWIMGSLLIGFTVYQLRSLRRMRFRATH
jgi:ABC-type sugar transport system permease subunit/ABC-type glycerol-3-phosphate transport system substrate-binding protein